MTTVKPRRGLRRSGEPATGTRTAVNRAIAQKLRKNDCDPIVLLARVATDEELPIELRFRAANTLARLAYAPSSREARREAPAPEDGRGDLSDVVAIIEANWRERREQEV